MNYSDEPHVIRGRKRSPKIWVISGLLLVFLVLLAWVALFPRIVDFQRRYAEFGPNGGTLYTISVDGNRYSLEIARSEELDYRLTYFLRPKDESVQWTPEEFRVRSRIAGQEEFEVLDWDEDIGGFGPSEYQLNPIGDYRVEVHIHRGDRRVWRGERWAFRLGSGHEGHGH